MTSVDVSTAAPKAAVKKKPKSSGGRGGAVPAVIKDFARILDAFAAKFPFAADDITELREQVAKLKDAWLLAEHENCKDHARVREDLGTMFNGTIELWLKKSADEERKAFFRGLGWRC